MIKTRKYRGDYEKHPEYPVMFKTMKLAEKYLGKLAGIEIGAAAHNPFGLKKCQNVAIGKTLDPDEEKLSRILQASMCGEYAVIDIDAYADDIPVEDNSQDYVLSSHVVEHFHDPISAFEEWNRITSDGGYIFMIIPKRSAVDGGREYTKLAQLIQQRGMSFEDFIGDQEYSEGTHPRWQHHIVFNPELMASLVEWCNKNIEGFNWQLVDSEETDSKVGNGHTFVYQVSKDA